MKYHTGSGWWTGAVTMTTVFAALKIAHVINWGWFWILAPLWIGFLIGLIIFAVVLIISILLTIFGG
jgi:hypothetical protein